MHTTTSTPLTSFKHLTLTLFLSIIYAGSSFAWQDNGVPICTAPESQGCPFIISDGVGGAIIAWGDWRSFVDGDIYAQRVDNAGNILWQEDGAIVITATGDQTGGMIVGDGSDGAIIVWRDTRSDSMYDIYAQRVDGNGILLWEIDGVPVCTSQYYTYVFDLTPDDSGGAFVGWIETDDIWWDTLQDVNIQRIDKDGNLLWGPYGTRICTTASGLVGTDISIVGDGTGAVIVIWVDGRNGWPKSDIYAQRIDGAGNALWGEVEGVPVCTTLSRKYLPQLCVDEEQGVVIVWDQHEGIYTQKLGISGNILWEESGVPICSTAKSGVRSCVSDDSGGAIIVWEDWREVNLDNKHWDTDIYAQRIDRDGNVLWQEQGVLVCEDTAQQCNPQLTGDGYGGAIIFWMDIRQGHVGGLYAQRLNSQGVTLWDISGVPICVWDEGREGRNNPLITTDGESGAIITWEDPRSFHTTRSDIYAQRVDSAGLTGIKEMPGKIPKVTLFQNYPNPFLQTTKIRYELDIEREALLQICDLTGRVVRTLINEHQKPGFYSIHWDGKSDSGDNLPNGIYFFKLNVGDETYSRKMIVLK